MVEAQRLERERTSGVGALVVVVLAVVHAALWGLAAWGLAPILDLFRQMSLDPYATGDVPDLQFVFFFVGLIPGAALGFALTSRATRLIPMGAAVLLPLATACVGIAVGLVIATPVWTVPERVGFSPGFFDDDPDTAWGPAQWIAYRVPLILPILFGVLALLLAVVILRLLAIHARKRRDMAFVLSSGVRVLGEVSDSTFTGTRIMGNPVIRLTVAYADAQGTARWVTKTRAFAPTAVPAIGQRFTVWYDPADPSNEERIVLAVGELTGPPPL
jgi:hypothetical protein